MSEHRISWKDDTRPWSEDFSDIFYAEEDGLAESRYVFIEQNEIPERWKGKDEFAIGELGFGTGLNLCAVLEAWHQTKELDRPRHLTYFSCERSPLSRDDITKALGRWEAALQSITNQWVPFYSSQANEFRLEIEDRISVHVFFSDVLIAYGTELPVKIDAWFLDGFAPRKNPDMWSEDVFKSLARNSQYRATATSYTVAGWVRRNLEAAGFRVVKAPGFGRKQEMTTARLE